VSGRPAAATARAAQTDRIILAQRFMVYLMPCETTEAIWSAAWMTLEFIS
jgi:hypothetical protein